MYLAAQCHCVPVNSDVRALGDVVVREWKWSDSEKKIARRAFQAALDAELAETIADFKRCAMAVVTADELWKVEELLTRVRREIDEKYDYRYSQLAWVFGRLLREGRIQPDELEGLSEEKLEAIQRIASL